MLVHFHETGQIVASVAVVRGRPYGHEIFVGEPFLVALLDQLVGSGDELHPIESAKVLNDPLTKQPSRTSLVLSPSVDLFWVRPHQIAEGSLVGNFGLPVDLSNLIEGPNIRRHATMHAQNLI